MIGQTVSDSYLMGIQEGRALLAQFARDGLANVATYRRALDTAQRAGRGAAQPMRDLYRGESEFWKAQIAKGESTAGA